MTANLKQAVSRIRQATYLHTVDDLTDVQLLAHYVSTRENIAFDMLVKRHGPMVLGVCRRLLRHPQDAEDAFQATFLVLVRKAASIRQPELIGNWLYGVAHRTAREARKARARRWASERLLKSTVVPVAKESDQKPEWLSELDQEINYLPAKYRAAVVMCELQGKTRQVAAPLLGIPEGTLSSRLATARKLLARRLSARQIALPLTGLATVASAREAISTSLMTSTSELASLVSAGKAVTAPAGLLMTGVLKAMTLNKLKIGALALLSFAVVLGGAGTLLPRSNANGEVPAEVALIKTAAFLARPSPDDREAILGTWDVVKLSRDGKEGEGEQVHKLVFTKDRVYAKKGDKWDKDPHTYKLDPSTNPKQFDLVELTAPNNKVWKGLYELNKDDLKIRSGRAGKDRPTRLGDGPDAGTDFMILKRSKVAEKVPPEAGKDEAHDNRQRVAPADIQAAAERLIKEQFPQAIIERGDDLFTAKINTMQYTLHQVNRDGSVSETTHQREGPKHDGFLVTISTKTAAYSGPLVVPQTLREPYWQRYVNSISDPNSDAHLWIDYAYGSRVPPSFHESFLAIIGSGPDRRQPSGSKDKPD